MIIDTEYLQPSKKQIVKFAASFFFSLKHFMMLQNQRNVLFNFYKTLIESSRFC